MVENILAMPRPEYLESLAALFIERKLTLAVAESCTGGLLGSLITSLAGASCYFKGGIICYANDAKINLLGVAPELLARAGAVSPQVAGQMARGAASTLRSDIAIGITGIAGPAAEETKKPVGLVYIGLYDRGREEIGAYHFDGDRTAIRWQAVEEALALLLGALG